MSTASATDELVDLGVDLDSEVPCLWAGRASDLMFHGFGFESTQAGACDGLGVAWLRTTACCGSRTMFCEGHRQRWNSIAARASEVLIHLPCGQARYVSDDHWVKI